MECQFGDQKPAVGEHRMCSDHHYEFEQVGWKFLKNGSRKRDGIVVTAAGSVKAIAPAYNTRMLMLLSGEIEVEDLDDDELARGMCRNPDGDWPRRQPELIPKMMFDRMQRELFARADEALRNNLMDAVGSIAEIAANPNVDAGQRLKAATWLFERLRGKTPDVIQLSAQKPYEEILDSVHRGPRPKSVDEPLEQTPPTLVRVPR
jgi:hypothetical protein